MTDGTTADRRRALFAVRRLEWARALQDLKRALVRQERIAEELEAISFSLADIHEQLKTSNIMAESGAAALSVTLNKRASLLKQARLQETAASVLERKLTEAETTVLNAKAQAAKAQKALNLLKSK